VIPTTHRARWSWLCGPLPFRKVQLRFSQQLQQGRLQGPGPGGGREALAQGLPEAREGCHRGGSAGRDDLHVNRAGHVARRIGLDQKTAARRQARLSQQRSGGGGKRARSVPKGVGDSGAINQEGIELGLADIRFGQDAAFVVVQRGR